jgi:hypothetical protein
MSFQNISHSLIRNDITEIGQRTDDPVVTPAGIFLRHLHDQSFQLGFDARPARVAAVFGSIKLLSNELPVPSQNGVRLGHAGHLGQCFSAESLANLGESGSLRIG